MICDEFQNNLLAKSSSILTSGREDDMMQNGAQKTADMSDCTRTMVMDASLELQKWQSHNALQRQTSSNDDENNATSPNTSASLQLLPRSVVWIRMGEASDASA